MRFKKDNVAETLKAHMMQERPNFAFRDCSNDHSGVNQDEAQAKSKNEEWPR